MITNIFVAILITTAVVGYDIAHTPKQVFIPVEQQIVIPTPIPTLEPITRSDNPIINYVYEIFGQYGDEAMKLLSCENKSLNPKAINDNTVWGGLGQDRGLFQISNYFHPGVSDECAFDYKCNTKYAYRMFINDNYTFRRWTCGK